MKRLLSIALVACALWLAMGFVRDALRSDEERIRVLLEYEVAAFNSANAFSTLTRFADDYRDTSGGFDRDMLRSALRYAFLTRRDAHGAFRHRCELGWDGLSIDVDDGGGSAEARFVLTLFATRDDDSPVDWEVDVTANLGWRDGGWLVVSSKHTTTRGKRPW